MRKAHDVALQGICNGNLNRNRAKWKADGWEKEFAIEYKSGLSLFLPQSLSVLLPGSCSEPNKSHSDLHDLNQAPYFEIAGTRGFNPASAS